MRLTRKLIPLFVIIAFIVGVAVVPAGAKTGYDPPDSDGFQNTCVFDHTYGNDGHGPYLYIDAYAFGGDPDGGSTQSCNFAYTVKCKRTSDGATYIPNRSQSGNIGNGGWFETLNLYNLCAAGFTQIVDYYIYVNSIPNPSNPSDHLGWSSKTPDVLGGLNTWAWWSQILGWGAI